MSKLPNEFPKGVRLNLLDGRRDKQVGCSIRPPDPTAREYHTGPREEVQVAAAQECVVSEKTSGSCREFAAGNATSRSGERSRFAKARAIEQHRDGGKGTFIGKRVRKQTTMAIVPEKLSIDSVYIISRSDVLEKQM